MTLVYADQVLVLNFLSDYVILLVSARLSGTPARRKRLFLGALAGAVYGLCAVLFPPLDCAVGKVLSAGVMTVLAFGKTRFLRRGLLFSGTGAAFSGAVTALSAQKPAALYITAAAFLLCLWIYPAVFRSAISHRVRGEIVKMTAELNGRETTFEALIDTGNSLRDPVSGTPVTVISFEAARPLFSAGTADMLSQPDWLDRIGEAEERFILIPFKAVSGGGILPAVRPDKLTKNGRECKELLAIGSVVQAKGFSALTGAEMEVK